MVGAWLLDACSLNAGMNRFSDERSGYFSVALSFAGASLAGICGRACVPTRESGYSVEGVAQARIQGRE